MLPHSTLLRLGWIALCSLLISQPSLVAQVSEGTDWRNRAAALSQIEARADSTNVELETKLIKLLETENDLVKSTLAKSKGENGVSVVLGEGYSEYYSRLYGDVLGLAEHGNEAAIPVLADGSFNIDSRVVPLLAQAWTVTLPIFLKRSRGSTIEKAQSFRMIGSIAQVARGRISAEQISAMKVTISQGLADSNPDVRIAAVRAVDEGRFTEFTPLLRGLARQDPAHYRGSAGRVYYPVREEAERAMQQLLR